MESSDIAKRLMEQVMGTGLLSMEDIAAITAGDLSSVQKLLPLLLQDEGFREMTAKNQQAEAASPVEGVAHTNGRTPAPAQQPEPAAPIFPGVASEFAVRLGRLLSRPELGRQIQINMQVNVQGVTFQAVRFVRDENGVHAEPYLEAVTMRHNHTGDWLVQTLQECVARLRTEAEDASLLQVDEEEGEGEEYEPAPPPRRVQSQAPRGRESRR